MFKNTKHNFFGQVRLVSQDANVQDTTRFTLFHHALWSHCSGVFRKQISNVLEQMKAPEHELPNTCFGHVVFLLASHTIRTLIFSGKKTLAVTKCR